MLSERGSRLTWKWVEEPNNWPHLEWSHPMFILLHLCSVVQKTPHWEKSLKSGSGLLIVSNSPISTFPISAEKWRALAPQRACRRKSKWVWLIEPTIGCHLGIGVCPRVEKIFYHRIVALQVQEAKVLLTLICVARAPIYKYRAILDPIWSHLVTRDHEAGVVILVGNVKVSLVLTKVTNYIQSTLWWKNFYVFLKIMLHVVKPQSRLL